MKEDFSDKIISELLDNEQFLQWVIAPTPKLDNYWEKRMDEDNNLRISIMTLREILKRLKIEEPTPSPKEKALIWEKIEKEIQLKEKSQRRYLPLWTKWASAAAIVAIIIGSFWVLYSEIDTIDEINYKLMVMEDDEILKSGNINLVLSDNQTIDIESDSLTIAYTKKGTIRIGEEEVIETSNVPQLNQLIVPYGKTTSIILSDGTKVWMNSGSKLIYPPVFDKNKREIFLSGEAYLDVVKDNTPFIIKTENIDVNVLGTQLNVMAYNNEQSQAVVLVSGSVEINSKELKRSVKLLPDQLLTYETSSNRINIQKVEVENYVSWIHGYLLLDRESMSGLLNKLSRHYNISFIYDVAEMMNISVSGKLDLEVNINKMLENIAITTPIAYEIGENIKIELLK